MRARIAILIGLVGLGGWLLAPAAARAEGKVRTTKLGSVIIKSNCSPAEVKSVGKKIQRCLDTFDDFYAEFRLRKKNDNRLVARVFATRDEFEQFYQKDGGGFSGTPLAYFSPSLNAIVLSAKAEEIFLSRLLLHECAHQYLNRYTYHAPNWLNEGLSETFEGWSVTDQGVVHKPNLMDLMILQEALRKDDYLPLEELMSMNPLLFREFAKRHPDLHSYLHYCTSWGLVYYCLEGPDKELRNRLITYVRDLNKIGDRAKFEVGDPAAFEARWKEYILGIDPKRENAEDHIVVASGFRSVDDFDRAIVEYEAALEKDPEAEAVQYWLGYCIKRSGGSYEIAAQHLEKAMLEDPTDPSPAYMLSRMALGIDRRSVQPDPVRALEYAMIALDLSGGRSPLYLWLVARCHAAAGKFELATRQMRRAIKYAAEDRLWYEGELKKLQEAARASG